RVRSEPGNRAASGGGDRATVPRAKEDRMRTTTTALAGAFCVLAFTGSALAGTMHPVLGAKLAGMGDHGVVNLQSHAAKNQLCWTFDLTAKGVTAASIRDAGG